MWSFWASADVLCCGLRLRPYGCIKSVSASLLLSWHVDTALSPLFLPLGCNAVDWDVCRTAVLELHSGSYSIERQGSSHTSLHSTSLSVSLSLSLLAAPVHVSPSPSFPYSELGIFLGALWCLRIFWASYILVELWWWAITSSGMWKKMKCVEKAVSLKSSPWCEHFLCWLDSPLSGFVTWYY